MKKTLITLLALAGVSMGADTPVWTASDVDLTEATKIDLSSLGLSTAAGEDGYTLMLTFSSDTAVTESQAKSILWLSSQETTYTGGSPYDQSTGTLCYASTNAGVQGLRLANAANGSTATNKTVWNDAGISDNSWAFGATTIFMTSKGGTATLYELDTDGSLKLTTQNNGLLSADVKSMWIGNWTADGSIMKAGTADMALFSGVLTETQMNSLIAPDEPPAVPEPTTATLSLLALAGLAARRRRR